MKTPRIEEMMREFERFTIMDGNKISLHGEAERAETWLRTALTEAKQAGIDEAVEKIKEVRKSAPDFSSLSVSVPIYNPIHELLVEEESGWNQCRERYEMLLDDTIKALQDNK